MTAARADAAVGGPRRRLQSREGASAGQRLADEVLRDSGRLGPLARRRAMRWLLRAVPAFAAGTGAALLVLGRFTGGSPGLAGGASLVLLGASAAWAGASALRRFRSGRAASAWEQLELGALLVVGAAVASALASPAGPGESPLFPLVYLVVAVAVAFLSRAVGFALVTLSAALQIGAYWTRGAPEAELARTASGVGFTLLFALLYHAILWSRLAAAARAEREAVERRLREIDERARELRLLTPTSGEGSDDPTREIRRARSAAVEMEAAVRGALEVAEVALRSHTCALFLLSPDDRELNLRECRSRSDRVTRRPVPAGDGVLGCVVSGGAPLRLDGEIRTATWYEDGTRPRALIAVPLVDRRGPHVRGVLVADRLEGEPFTAGDEELLVRVAGELIRAEASERLLLGLARERDEKEAFYDAIERLNRTSKTRDVLDATIEVAGRFAPIDFAAVSLVSEPPARPRHQVVRAEVMGGAGAERRTSEIEGLRFGENAGLVASAIRLGSALPGTAIRVSETVVFDEATRLKGLGSLKVLPLKTGAQVLGALVLGARREQAFDREATRQLEVIAMQAADALLRARLFEQTERLATSDGLTGLANHRTFQARLDEQLALAHRYGKPLAVVLCDVDHFKGVNDTHGHPAGDAVLQGTARLLAKEARATDLVARYGGEEFALVMPETDAAGARIIAERIRARVAEAAFPTEKGSLKVTVSLGIASFPADGRTKARVVEAADACLYQAKRSGRNRVVSASPP